MQYDLIALDLDGTALSSNHEVQRSTVDAVRWARAQGVHVVLSTGRICAEAAEFARRLGTDDEMVTSGGAALSSVSTGACFEQVSIPWEQAARAAEVLERTSLITMAYINENLVLNPYSDSVFGQYKSNEGYLAVKQVVPSVAAYIAQEHLAADKMFSRGTNPAVLAQARAQLEKLPGVRVMSSFYDNIEVISPHADKGRALGRLCARYGTTLARTIAIGDSENDLEMLRAVGMPVAMGNAVPEAKALARYHTADNNHGGVAQAIYHLLGREDG